MLNIWFLDCIAKPSCSSFFWQRQSCPILADALSFWVLAYFTMALKRVYGGTWIETLGRGFAISGLYFAIIFVMNLLLVFFLLAL